MPALVACGAGVHVEALQLIVVHHFQDMGMPADEQLRGTGDELFFDVGCITGWVTADVRHVHFHAFALPAQLFGVYGADVVAIDIAVYTFQWFECAELLGKGDGAEIAGMPYFIALVEMGEHGGVEIMVGV